MQKVRVSVLPPEGVRIGPGPGVPRVPGVPARGPDLWRKFPRSLGSWGTWLVADIFAVPGGPGLCGNFSRAMGDLWIPASGSYFYFVELSSNNYDKTNCLFLLNK